jgi:dTDP-4-dehydrorhamnose 3,5-epimerase
MAVSAPGSRGSYGSHCSKVGIPGPHEAQIAHHLERHRAQGRRRRKGDRVETCPVPRIADALLFKPTPHVDERGFFCRTFDVEVVRAAGIVPAEFAQDSLSRSACGVVRGLHVRRGTGEAKLVRCSYGAIFDVIVDLRPGSPTYRNWQSFELCGDEQVSLYVPAGCAHGFQALTQPTDVSYRIDRAHDPAEDVSIAFDDPELAIPWPLPVAAMSHRDRQAMPLAAAEKLLESFAG